jgi:hypothetical protein
MSIRRPAVAGQFYSGSPDELRSHVKSLIGDIPEEKVEAIGLVSPHAGLIYSGKVAGAVFSRIKGPKTFIIIGPNHTGLGKPVSIMSSGKWQIPTGEIEIDNELSIKIMKKTEVISEDSLAHSMEHSLEVQLPFINYLFTNVKIVPIVMMADSIEICKEVGEAVASAIGDTEYPVTVVASSDMSHYVSDSVARRLDQKAIDRIIELDPEGLYRTVKKDGISMCGVIPVTTMLFAALSLGAKKAELIKYMTSAEVSGDFNYVVGYAGVIVS